ncbi:MAG: hypothetical protein Q7S74_00845, partial [Nanoarchaeota archaeon]|nr:hypothetical protein [Nanoarchaeota archaeon]
KVDSQNNMEFILQRNAGKGNVVGFVIVLEDTTKKISTITKYNTTSLEELNSILVNISAVEHGLTEDIIKISVYVVGISTDISISIVSSNPVATAGTGSGSGGGGGGGGSGGGGIGNQVECVVDSACNQNINYCLGICTASNTCDYGHTKADNTQCPTGGTCQAPAVLYK